MTPNIPPEVLALARKHINKVDPDFGSDVDKIVIAAIMEVTERAIDRVMKCDFDDEGDFIVSALRNMEHLK